MSIKLSTTEIYNEQAGNWSRTGPTIVSDFTGRPPTIDLCGNVEGKNILDLGCGEGYCSRILATKNPAKITGVDISKEMISRAIEREESEKLGISYFCKNAADYDFKESFYDLILGMFIFNYVPIQTMRDILSNIHSSLKENGEMVFAVPHPSLAFIKKEKVAPFYFDHGEYNYFSAKDIELEGKIWRRSGEALNVRSYHKTFEDYVSAINDAGFSKILEVKELSVTNDILNIDPGFFESLVGVPLHVAFKVRK